MLPLGTFATYAKEKPAILRSFDITMPKEECFDVARKVAERYVDRMDVTFDGPIITFKGRYSFAINCIEEHNVIHIFTDRSRNDEHQIIFNDFIETYKKIGKTLESTHEEA